jgi:hypothetical protein
VLPHVAVEEREEIVGVSVVRVEADGLLQDTPGLVVEPAVIQRFSII